jgi:hypothetical protein
VQTEVLLGQRPKTVTHNTPDGTIYGAALSRVHPLSTFALLRGNLHGVAVGFG